VGVLDKILRAGEGKILRKLDGIAKAVNAIEEDFVSLSDAELRALTDEYKKRYSEGESLDDLLPEAFATVREAAKRTLGQRHYDVQIMGGAALHLGNIAEMRTGEGKTLVATLPAYLNACRATACTSSPSTTTSPSATPSGWVASTGSSASRSASSSPT